MKKKISIICPVFNEENCIPPFFDRIKIIKDKLIDYEIKLIFSIIAQLIGHTKF